MAGDLRGFATAAILAAALAATPASAQNHRDASTRTGSIDQESLITDWKPDRTQRPSSERPGDLGPKAPKLTRVLAGLSFSTARGSGAAGAMLSSAASLEQPGLQDDT